MGDRQDLGAGFLAESVEKFPQILWILAVELGIRHQPVGLARIPTKQHIAVQIIAAHGGVFKTNDSRESAWVVVMIGQSSICSPGIADGFVIVDGGIGLR